MKRLRTVNRRGRQAEQRAASDQTADNGSGSAEQAKRTRTAQPTSGE
jgi:hypothetical protein